LSALPGCPYRTMVLYIELSPQWRDCQEKSVCSVTKKSSPISSDLSPRGERIITISLPFSLPARSRFGEGRGEGGAGVGLIRCPFDQLENRTFLPLPWRERAGVRGTIRQHPHLNPPPSRGRRIIGYFHDSKVPLDMRYYGLINKSTIG
jgi:hypothetical protein